MTSQDVEKIGKELQKLARAQSSVRFESDHAPLIAQLTADAGLETRQELVDRAISILPSVPAQVATLLIGSHENRYIHSLGERRKRAAKQFNFSSETFRKRYKNKPSHYQQLLISVGRAMVATSNGLAAALTDQITATPTSQPTESDSDSQPKQIDQLEFTAEPQREAQQQVEVEAEVHSGDGEPNLLTTQVTTSHDVQDSDGSVDPVEGSVDTTATQTGAKRQVSEAGRSKKLRWVLAAALCLVLVGVLTTNMWRRARTSDSPFGSTVTTAAGASGLDVIANTKGDVTESGQGENVSAIPVVEPIEGCDFPVGVRVGGVTTDVITESAQKVYRSTKDQGVDLGCPKHVMTKWQDFWVQETHATDTQPEGVIVAHADMSEALWVEASLWTGYKRQMSGEMYDIEGVPVHFEMFDTHPRLVLASGAELISIQTGGSAKYVPSKIVDQWGGIEGPLGIPFTDIHYSEGFLRLEFAKGHMVMKSDDEIVVHIASEDDIASQIEVIADITGPGIIRTFDGTAWHLDTDGVRHWIPDVDEWFCAGGDEAVIIGDTPAWALTDRYPIGDVAKCSDFD